MQPGAHIDFCLLIPCFNNYEGLIRSLQSVVYRRDRYRVIVVDDGSDQPVTKGGIVSVLGDDFPVILLRNEKNRGITYSLNKGLRWINDNLLTNYIARLDCGDTCDPARFTEQVKLLDNNPGIGLVGSWCRFESTDKKNYIYTTPLIHKDIFRKMHFRNVFIHPTILFRFSLARQVGYYPEDFEYAEDYALCWLLIKQQKSAIIGKVLVTCELNKTGISYANKGKQLSAKWKVIKKLAPRTILKIPALLRLIALFFLPKELILRLKLLIK